MENLRNQKLPFSKKKLPKKVLFSYILDYLIIVILIGAFYALDSVEPYHQHFSLQNYTLHYPYAVHERVSVFWLCVIAVAAPAAIIAFYTLVIDGIFSHQAPIPSGGRGRKLTGRYRMKDRLWELNCGLLGLMLGVGAAFTITGTLKNAIGKPRPDLIDRCQPPPDSIDPKPFGLSNHSICTQTNNAILKDGFRSFPSGHSSTAFAGLYYLSIYLAAKLHVLDSKGEVWKAFIVLIPTLGAALVAGSRIMDARHHPFDVITGSLLGILCAWGAYRQYFPPVSETWRKGRAYPIRSWGKPPEPPMTMAMVPQSDDDLARTLPPGPKSGPDEEQPLSAVSTGVEEHHGNVFRAQVTASNRHRELQRNGTNSTYSSTAYSATPHRHPTNATYTSQLPATNPFATTRNRAHDEWDESSSEDDNYELRPQYTLTHSNTDPPSAGGHYNPHGYGHREDTGYHTPTQLTEVVAPRPPALRPDVTQNTQVTQVVQEPSSSLPPKPVAAHGGQESGGAI